MKCFALLLSPLLLLAASVQAQEVVRHVGANARLPIAAAVEVPPGKTVVYLGGHAAKVANPSAPANTVAAYGDTRTQALGTLASLQARLQSLGLGMGDVVKMQAFLVGVPEKGGAMDFDGFNEAYREFFGTADQPDLPVRTTLQVAGLGNPGLLVEIEVTAVRP